MNETFEEVLQKYGELTYTNKGNSMMPMLRPQKDVFRIEPGKGRAKENDVVLFKHNGRYVLHRVVEVFEDHYTMLGDNCINCETNVKDKDILGILVWFQRGNKRIDIDDPSYKLYVKLLRLSQGPRIFIKKKYFDLRRWAAGIMK